jgi:hypothetical protein
MMNHSNKIEMRDWDQYNTTTTMMNSSYSTPTAIGSYTQLDYHLQEKKKLPPPPPPPPRHHHITNPNIIVDNQSCDHNNNKGQVEIPNRRQSHLYTPFHDNNALSDNNNYNNRRSYYASNLAPIDTTISNSSLSRSATWQPSTSSTPSMSHEQQQSIPLYHTTISGNHHQQHYLSPVNADIPARRTSRNYTNNPEIQAKLDAMLSSDRALFLSTVLHNTNLGIETSSSTTHGTTTVIYRRSTTPASRPI